MEDETKDIGADETTLMDGAADGATTLLSDAADDATTLLDGAADDATTLLSDVASGAAVTEAIAPDETGLFAETDILETSPSEDEAVDEYLPSDEFPEESDDEYDRRMMIMAAVGAVVFVLAIIAGLALSGAGSRLFHLFFVPAPIDEAPETLLAPEEPTQPVADTRPTTTPSGPVNAAPTRLTSPT
ncbi:MAG: hypothetical protein IJM67_03515 [Atopobiaceae bacterium]|nr:hypothetical protein [Atopobiaceae bacterium]